MRNSNGRCTRSEFLAAGSIEQLQRELNLSRVSDVLLITPKPEPAIVLAGSPIFTTLKMLKNSDRNCSTVSSDPLLRRPMGYL